MFSFGWGEILLILIVVIIVVGPKDIPKFLRQIGNLSKSIKKISREFKSSLNQIAEETDLKDVKNSITEITDLNKEIDIKSKKFSGVSNFALGDMHVNVIGVFPPCLIALIIVSFQLIFPLITFEVIFSFTTKCVSNFSMFG